MIGILLVFAGFSLLTVTAVELIKDPPKIESAVHEDQGRYNR